MVIDEADAFRTLGFNVMLVDLRAHGNSGGKASSMGYKESEEVQLAYDYVRQAGEKNIFIWGASMGAVIMIKAVADSQLQPSGIIVEMPFLSLQTHSESKARFLGFPRQPFGFLTSFWIGVEQGFNGLGFKTTRYAKKVTCPVLMQYGEKDELVLRYEINAVYEAIASSNKKLVIYDDAAHESFLKKDPVTWKKEVSAFLKIGELFPDGNPCADRRKCINLFNIRTLHRNATKGPVFIFIDNKILVWPCTVNADRAANACILRNLSRLFSFPEFIPAVLRWIIQPHETIPFIMHTLVSDPEAAFRRILITGYSFIF